MKCSGCGIEVHEAKCPYCGNYNGKETMSSGYRMMLLTRLLNDNRYNYLKRKFNGAGIRTKKES